MQIEMRAILTAWRSYFESPEEPTRYQFQVEYAIVDKLLEKQSNLLKDTLLYTGVKDYNAQPMYEMVVFTAKAFENTLYQRTE